MSGRDRWRVHAGWAAALLVAVLVTWWSAGTLAAPASGDQPTAELAPTYTVAAGEVGVTIPAQGTVTFAEGPAGVAGRSGTLTTIDVDPKTSIRAGDVLFTVDMQPVVAARGTVPSYRELSHGAQGRDVAQLRRFLGLGPGDEFDWTTYYAVAAWQEEVGLRADGVVRRGDLLFLPSLPTRGNAADDARVGSTVSPGQAVVTTVRERPAILVSADLGGGQLTAGMTARVQVGERQVTGVLSGPIRSDGLLSFTVETRGGRPVCGPRCAARLPIVGEPSVSVEIDLMPRETGLVVPDSALGVQPDGSSTVLEHGGDAIPVDVVASGQGMSVVEGVAEGTVIELFAEDAP